VRNEERLKLKIARLKLECESAYISAITACELPPLPQPLLLD
jgi:hypothetical protein